MCDNTVTVVWTLAEPDSKIDHYILEHRRTNHEGPPRIREDYPWMVVEGIREMEHTITGRRGSYIYICIYYLFIFQIYIFLFYFNFFIFRFPGLRFDTRYMTFRVRACNKAVAGDFSEPVTIETHGKKIKHQLRLL